MKSRTLIAGMVGCSLALGLAAFAAQNDPKRPNTPPGNAPARTAPAAPAKTTTATLSPEEAMMKAGMVGPQHKALEPLIGTWNANCTFWMMGPESQPEKSTGTLVSKWIFDGRWIQSDYAGQMGDMPFTGLAYLGFDNTKQKYIGTWMDSMSTAMMFSTGTANPTGKVITFTSGPDICCMTGKPVTSRNVLTIESNDRNKYEFFHTYPGEKEFKAGEIIYTRKK